MNFKENSNTFFTYSWLGFTCVEFIIEGEIIQDSRQIIQEFISSPQDFEPARKYFDGYVSDHTDETGERVISRLYEFGSYPINSLEISDYKKTKIEDFERQISDLISEFKESERPKIEYQNFKNQVATIFENLESPEFYVFSPEKSKHNNIGAFEIEEFLCGFLIDFINRRFKVILLAVD